MDAPAEYPQHIYYPDGYRTSVATSAARAHMPPGWDRLVNGPFPGIDLSKIPWEPRYGPFAPEDQWRQYGGFLPPRTMLCSRGALVILCTALLFCNACATQVLHQAGGIDPGATRAQVREILGNPQDRQFRGSQEAWQYCQTGLVNDTFVVVWFVDATVQA